MSAPADSAPATFAEVVRARRDELDMTQADLAERVGLKQPAVAAWEAGAKIPTVPTLVALADVLGIDRGRFFELAAAVAV